MRRHFEEFLRPGEVLDMSKYPWPLPKMGDIIRARCSWDLDPKNRDSTNTLRYRVLNCVVWSIDDSFIYFRDIEGEPEPEGIVSRNGGTADYWGALIFTHYVDNNWVPLYAIKRPLLGDYAQKLARRSENIERGLFS